MYVDLKHNIGNGAFVINVSVPPNCVDVSVLFSMEM